MKKIGFKIRPATTKDKNTLMAFGYKLSSAEGSLEPNHPYPTQKEVEREVRENLKNKNYYFFLAEVNGKPVAFAAASKKKRTHGPKWKGTFEAIWVEPKYRRQGISHALSQTRLDKLRKYKLDSISIYIRPKNKESIANIKKLGGHHTLNVYTIRPKK